jgi:hypothetical protein
VTVAASRESDRLSGVPRPPSTPRSAWRPPRPSRSSR